MVSHQQQNVRDEQYRKLCSIQRIVTAHSPNLVWIHPHSIMNSPFLSYNHTRSMIAISVGLSSESLSAAAQSVLVKSVASP
jgi:hypothetical protein